MKLSFKTSRFLMTSFTALTLMGVQDVRAFDVNKEEEIAMTVASAASQNNASMLIELPYEIKMIILKSLDPKSLAAVAQTSKDLAEVVSDSYFQKTYSGVTLEQYVNLVKVQIPAVFGKAYGDQIRTFLSGKPWHVYSELLHRLMATNNVDLLWVNENALLKTIFTGKIKDSDGLLQNVITEKTLTIAAHAAQIFTEDMNEEDRSEIKQALASLTPKQISDFAEAITNHGHQFFEEKADGFIGSLIIVALAPLSPNQIADFAKALSLSAIPFVSPGMGRMKRYRIIRRLAPLSPEQIAEVAKRLAQGDNAEKRIKKIKAYIEELGTVEN